MTGSSSFCLPGDLSAAHGDSVKPIIVKHISSRMDFARAIRLANQVSARTPGDLLELADLSRAESECLCDGIQCECPDYGSVAEECRCASDEDHCVCNSQQTSAPGRESPKALPWSLAPARAATPARTQARRSAKRQPDVVAPLLRSVTRALKNEMRLSLHRQRACHRQPCAFEWAEEDEPQSALAICNPFEALVGREEAESVQINCEDTHSPLQTVSELSDLSDYDADLVFDMGSRESLGGGPTVGIQGCDAITASASGQQLDYEGFNALFEAGDVDDLTDISRSPSPFPVIAPCSEQQQMLSSSWRLKRTRDDSPQANDHGARYPPTAQPTQVQRDPASFDNNPVRGRKRHGGGARGRGRGRGKRASGRAKANVFETPHWDHLPARGPMLVRPSSPKGGREPSKGDAYGGNLHDVAAHQPKRKKPRHDTNHGEQRREHQQRMRADKREREEEAKAKLRDSSGPWGRQHPDNFARSRQYRVYGITADAEVEYAVCRGGFRGKRRLDEHNLPKDIATLDALEFWRYDWNDELTHIITDDHDRIIVVLVGPSRGEGAKEFWSSLFQRLSAKLHTLPQRRPLAFPRQNKDTANRGDFHAINFGVSYGGGNLKPQAKVQRNKKHGSLAQDELRADEDLQKVASFQSEALAAWFPRAYHHLRCAMNRLHARDPSLQPNFPGSVYPMACANCGPRTVCKLHCDSSNYPGLPCAITAMGEFNADLGGHLILPQFRMYVRFAAGRTILLSSACIQHANVDIGVGETRESFTQYCPAGLLEWAAHDYKPAKKFSTTPALRDALERNAGEGWNAQLGRLSTPESVGDDRRWVLQEEQAGRLS